MEVNMNQVVAILLPMVTAMVPQIKVVEDLVKELEANGKTMTAEEKKVAIVALAKNALEGAELISGKDLLDNEEVVAAVTSVMDSLIHLSTLVASVKK